MFGLGWPELLALVVIALLVFGPEKLPQAASQAGRTLRQLRQMANSAKADLQANLGPEFSNFDPADLNPKAFVRKHLFDDLEKDWNSEPSDKPDSVSTQPELGVGEIPPYDNEAT
ncbi:twin-arginine translocase subunit TatB [Microbispora sp. RL4-1S]|uniref:Twin-arginine translocase subunit TatB n=1 Tax=Microbispora oryzae TaxID=2806554 RepID=A0A941AKZ1_9ACTN|nr:sec-independent translocase [Microbispora oryzae]MBP2707651.1 twin-arginine translocase subunit TatB [Microbispora oryzae]